MPTAPVTLLPSCPLCDEPIGVYEEYTIYVEDDYKCLAHLDCVVNFGDDEIEEDTIEFVQFPEDDDDEEDDEWN